VCWCLWPRDACEHVASQLCQAGIDATAFHGEMRQGACPGALSDFKAGRGDVVVTTDLAVRGNGGVKGKRPSKKDKLRAVQASGPPVNKPD
jgi:hypothetical protein